MTLALLVAFSVVTHTPVWVWAVFALVAFMGYQRTRDRTVEVWRLFLFPVVIVLLQVSGIVEAGLGITLSAILLGSAAGGTVGWLLEREGATVRLANNRVWLRGEWWSMVQVLLILAVHYGTAVTSAVNPAFASQTWWQIATALVSSLLSAMVVGRMLARLRVYFRSAPADAPAA